MQLFSFFPAGFRQVLPAHRGRLIFVYALLIAENILNLIMGWVMGYTINALAAGNIAAIWPIIAQLLGYLVTGTLRRYADTRVYSAIYTDFVNHTIAGQLKRHTPVSLISARVHLSREYIEFLEKDMASLAGMFFNVAGAAVMLLGYSFRLFAVSLLVLGLCLLILRRYGRVIGKPNNSYNNLQEQQVDVLIAGKMTAVKRLFRLMRLHQIRISDAGAAAFLAMEIFLFGLIAYAVWLATGGMPAGDVFGMLNYILSFVTGIYSLPLFAERISRLKDIRARLD
ncbi:hypothetical protein ECE50_002835 [Chitinophaga sp. Mgbs1]|uniref:Uncharacterized protein n=1 Tax=Chitinophaga solisilvae TaxID=1233460 RepID=A0A3S1B1G0_9BACT|nr:hypothetical protein [Chitinophaga solisilvae]